MGKTLLLFFFLFTLFAQSQEAKPRDLFSDAIGKNIRKYKRQSRVAHARKDLERARFLFDSLVDHVVNGTYLDDFKVRRFPKKKISLYEYEKPIFLITTATWCAAEIGEIPALNSLADEYYKQVDFIVLFWGSKKKIRKIKRQYSSKIHILYVDEKENKHDFPIRSMKHSFGLPTSFIVDRNKMILDVRRTYTHHYKEDFTTSYNNHFQAFMSGLSVLLNLEEYKSNSYFTKNSD